MRLQTREKAMGSRTAQLKMLLVCVKTTMRESGSFEQEETDFGGLVTFCCGTFAMVFHDIGSLFVAGKHSKMNGMLS